MQLARLLALPLAALAGRAAAARGLREAPPPEHQSAAAAALRPERAGPRGAACLVAEAAFAALGDRGAAHTCPVSLPTKQGADDQKPFITKLLATIINGNGVFEGCRNESAQEHYVETFSAELECLYAILLKDQCGGLPSRHAERQEPWERSCLDPSEDLFVAYDLMSSAEKQYFHSFKKSASERQIYATFLELAGYKELVCIFMKTVDDECVAFPAPRLLPPSHWHADWK